MIPAPPLDADGALATSWHEVVAALRPGILAPCCICRRSSVWHWFDGECYHPLHNTLHCITHLFDEWRSMIVAGEVRSAGETRLTGAYARRARVGGDAVTELSSRNGGSPYFWPGMPTGTPWTVVARLADGREVITPCAHNATHARRVNTRWCALARRGIAGHPGNAVPICGWIVDPAGQHLEKWDR
jgi:hypothetical protein